MALFDDFGFEDGSITGWTKGGGTWRGGAAPVAADYLPQGSAYTPSVAEIAVTSSGKDSRTNNVVTTVYDGAHSVLLNGGGANQSVSVLSQHVNNYGGSALSFAYAAVLQDSHKAGEADGFSITLTDTTTGEILFSVDYDSASAARTFTLSSSSWYYQDWQAVTVDTSDHRGDDFTISVLAYDCALGGHGGSVYFDGFDVPTGQVSGTLFQDWNASGARDPKEPAIEGWTVYADTDGNGRFDAGEASAITDARGRYLIGAVPVGTATIRVDAPTGTWEAWAATPATVTVAKDAPTTAVDFAVTGGATPFDDVLTGVGRADETIDGLAGNDLITGRAGNDALSGGLGDDIVRGNGGTDTVAGGSGNDHVNGGSGSDIVAGGGGADVLRGGLDADTFLFAADFGKDRIADFEDGVDRIEFTVAGVNGVSDLVLTQQGADTLVTLAAGGPGEILIRDVLTADLTDADFLFAPPAPGTSGAPAISIADFAAHDLLLADIALVALA